MEEIYDKLDSRGATELRDWELLALLVESEALAQTLLSESDNSLVVLVDRELPRLRMMGGLGLRRAMRLKAAAELGRRAALNTAPRDRRFDTSLAVAELFRPKLDTLPYEECWALYLSSTNGYIEEQIVGRGGVQGTTVDHRLVVKRALELLAPQFILVHNHPSRTAEPSPQDRMLTERVAAAAALFDIRLLDHVIVARTGHYSFRDMGLLK